MPNDIIDVETVQRRPDDSLKTWGWVSYILHLVVAVGAVVPGAQVSLVLLFVALAIDLIKRDDARGTWQESHFRWRLRSVVWVTVLYLLTFWGFLLGLFLFNPIWVLVSVWFLYRIVRGMVSMDRGVAIEPGR